MRGKEEAHDYRYFPDPDLPPLVLPEGFVEEIGKTLPELPAARRTRWQTELGLTAYDAEVLSSHPRVAAYFEDAVEEFSCRLSGDAGRARELWNAPSLPQGPLGFASAPSWMISRRREAGKKAANFIQNEILRWVETNGLEATFPVAAWHVAELLSLVEDGTLSGKLAKQVIAEMREGGESAKQVIDRLGLAQVSDSGAIEAIVREVIDASSEQVAKYRAGNEKLLGYFVGQVMKKTGGRANPQLVNDLIKKMLAF
jgi:aspartyl-tRNA(Asn)/glutamyl-tRNA(Gln) amidotransferase subunit B